MAQLWSGIDFIRKHADSNRDDDMLGREKRQLAFPIKPGRRDRRIRQPIKSDVIKNIVFCKALGLTVKHACDKCLTCCVVVGIQAARPTGESSRPYSVCGRSRPSPGHSPTHARRKWQADHMRAVRRPKDPTAAPLRLQAHLQYRPERWQPYLWKFRPIQELPAGPSAP